MKKIFVMVLVLVLLMGLAACGAKTQSEATTAATEATTEAPTTEETTEATEPETEAPKPGAGIRVEPYFAEDNGSIMNAADITYVDGKTVKVDVYKPYMYPAEVMDTIDVGSILVVNGEDVEVTSLVREENKMIINDDINLERELVFDPMTLGMDGSEPTLGDYYGYSVANFGSLRGMSYSNEIPLSGGFTWDNIQAYDGSNTVSGNGATFMEALKEAQMFDSYRASVLISNDTLTMVWLFPAN